MLKDITIGRYFPVNSVFHRLDPRTKIVVCFSYIIGIFLCKSYISLAFSAVALLAMMLLSKIPLKMYLKSTKAILPIIIFTAFLNIFYITKGTVIISWRFIRITDGGLFTALFMAVRILQLIMASSLLTYTTTPTALTDGMERLLSPLKLFHIPVHTLAMMMTLALRFIPTLIDEIERIMNAQKARGADLESGSIVQRLKALVPILVPLFVSAFRRAYELAFAMECRCYTGGEGRTRMKQMKIRSGDIICLVLFVTFVFGILFLNQYGVVI